MPVISATLEAEAGEWQVLGQPQNLSEVLSQNKKNNNNKIKFKEKRERERRYNLL